MKKFLPLLIVAAFVGFGALAEASDFSYEGFFTQDDNVQFFGFHLGQAANVTLKTLSFAGGLNSAGVTVADGGFDPVLAVFKGTFNGPANDAESLKSLYVAHNDDDPAKPYYNLTTDSWDSYVNKSLDAGDYTVALVQYDNFYKSGIWDANATVFKRFGQGNFTGSLNGAPIGTTTAFWISDDETGLNATRRDGHWSVDILNVDSATRRSAVTPEPVSSALFLLGGGVFVARRFRKGRKK